MIISLHCQDNTSLAVKYSTYWESVKRNRVSPWDGSPFDSVCKHRLNEKLEMRNGGAAHKNIEAPQNFDSASRHRHLERSPRSSLQNGQLANCAISITVCF
jgi:hypothetical protein